MLHLHKLPHNVSFTHAAVGDVLVVLVLGDSDLATAERLPQLLEDKKRHGQTHTPSLCRFSSSPSCVMGTHNLLWQGDVS